MEIFYTKEDKEKIETTIKYFVGDLITLWEKSGTDYLTIDSSFLGIESGSTLTINKKGVILTTYKRVYDDYDYMFGGMGSLKKHRHYVLGRKNKKEIKLGLKDEDVLVPLISNYEKIRREFLFETTKHTTAKARKTDEINEWYNRFRRETEIEMDLPKTSNQHELVVTSEDGKTIGTIDFGDKIIKIITRGDIRVIDKREEELPKVKHR